MVHYFEHKSGQVADEIISRGVQLPDLFAVLPANEANVSFNASWQKYVLSA